MKGTWVAGAAVAALLGIGARGGEAQEVSFGAGFSTYDLSGTGTSWVASARYLTPMSALLDLEVGASVFRYENQVERHQTFLFPEIGVVAPFRVKVIPLYLAAGAGGAFLVEGEGDAELTLFGAVGLDLNLDGGWALKPEMRIRVVDPWVGTLADFTLSLSRSMGR